MTVFLVQNEAKIKFIMAQVISEFSLNLLQDTRLIILNKSWTSSLGGSAFIFWLKMI